MLNEVYVSNNVAYLTGVYNDPLGVEVQVNLPPYIETVDWLIGLLPLTYSSATSPAVVALWTWNAYYKPIGWYATPFYLFDIATGEFVQRADNKMGAMAAVGGGSFAAIQATSGSSYIVQGRTVFLDQSLIPLILVLDANTQNLTVSVGTSISLDALAGPLPSVVGFDDQGNYIVYADGDTLAVSNWSTKALLVTYTMPAAVSCIAMTGFGSAYILCANSVLVLLDYMHNRIMGAVKLPAAPSSATGAAMCYYSTLNRLLICWQTPDNPDGSSTICIQGYNLTPISTRMTTPIPLQVPKKGRTIQMLVNVVGDMNEGVGSAILTSTITGVGTLPGEINISDNEGRAKIPVLCTAAGEVALNCTSLSNYASITPPSSGGGTQVATPNITPNGGSFSGGALVTLSSNTVGASLYYTLDGSTPTTSSTYVMNGGALSLGASCTLKVIATMTGQLDSLVALAVFMITAIEVTDPVINVDGQDVGGGIIDVDGQDIGEGGTIDVDGQDI